tara:strand:+ start:399 stop:659 length:261 start_codon:yes stop_codon:yes gene_type:complete
METEFSAETVQAAKTAVRTLYTYRHDMADTLAMMDWVELVQGISADARAEGRKISAADWVEMAHGADDICDEDCLPRLFRIEGADA